MSDSPASATHLVGRRTSAALALCLVCSAGGAADVIAVDTGRVLRTRETNPIGINFNYLRDDDANRPAGARRLHAAMKDMGVVWVRYPGGEKSDWHMFAAPPYATPAPQSVGWYKSQVRDSMDFDEYMRCLRTFGGRPLVVVPYESQERSGKTRAEFLAHAVAWVKYANVTKRYGVLCWEIGNENWHNKTGNARQIGEVARDFAIAMKRVDPTIRVGVSGNSTGWFKTVLGIAGEHLDFLTVSNYRGWPEGFERYRRTDRVELDGPTRGAARAIAESPHRDRITVVAAEFNAVDWKKQWKPRNDLGHAIVSFDIAGQLVLHPRLECAMLWTTRWVNAEKPDSMWYGLGARNEILAAGRAVAIWGQFLKPRMVAVKGPAHTVCYASYDARTPGLTVFAINKNRADMKVDVAVSSRHTFRKAVTYHFSGTGEADTNPVWRRAGAVAVGGNRVRGLLLPGTSITVVDLEGGRR